MIYHIYGREIAANLSEIDAAQGPVRITGFIGKPVISRGNRAYENYFINGRYIKSNVIARGIEEGYRTFMMQHKYPFTALHFTIDGKLLDVNVHPTKMELRFSNQEELYRFVRETVKGGLMDRELIPEVKLTEMSGTAKPEKAAAPTPAPTPAPAAPSTPRERNLEYFMARMKQRVNAEFEEKKAKQEHVKSESIFSSEELKMLEPEQKPEEKPETEVLRETGVYRTEEKAAESQKKEEAAQEKTPEQLTLFDHRLLNPETKSDIIIIGQLFETYWLVQFEDKFYMIDQHAAHEKVLYERTVKTLAGKEITSQMVSPPLILSLNMQEEAKLAEYRDYFSELGFEIEPFGGKEYAISAVPANLYGLAEKDLFLELLDDLEYVSGKNSEMILDKIASMSCKAAVKGNQRLSTAEARELIEELLTLENPYNCPHGRPTIISMTKQEIEKKFKRIV